MPTITLSEKKLKKIARINEAVKDYFISHPSTDLVAATHLMPLFIRKRIFLKDTENGLPVRAILRELYKTGQLHLLTGTIVMIEKRSYFFIEMNEFMLLPILQEAEETINSSNLFSAGH